MNTVLHLIIVEVCVWGWVAAFSGAVLLTARTRAHTREGDKS